MLILLAGAGLLLLVVGGELLVRGASALALRFGVSPLAVGLTVVAFGTSTPELVVSLDAALSGAGDVSLGNVVGSNICNIALILGASVLLSRARIHAKLLRWDVPLLVGVSCLLAALLANGHLSRGEGAALLVGLVIYTVFTFLQARREPRPVREELAEAAPTRPLPTGLAVAFVPLGLLALVGGGRLLVTAAVGIAESLGVSQAVIGLTVVALGTSLPELATSLIAAVRGQSDIAVGNVVGSNLFNVLGILGTTAMVQPLTRGGIGWIDLGVMLAVTVLLLPLMRTGFELKRWEGALLLAGYVAYVAWLLVGQTT